MEKECGLIVNLLKELIKRNCLDKVDKIFHSGESPYQLVNFISRVFKDKFESIFKLFP